MNTETQELDLLEKPLGMNPKKFGLWLFIVSVTMIFASMTSAYIVKSSEDNWKEFDLPSMFLYSCFVIVLSSVTVQTAFYAAKKDNFNILKIFFFISVILGFVFLYAQWEGWKQLVAANVYFADRTTASGSFVYVLSGLHAAHIISAIVVLVFGLVKSFQMKIHSKNMLFMEMCTTYWHYLGALWLYLYFFLILFRN